MNPSTEFQLDYSFLIQKPFLVSTARKKTQRLETFIYFMVLNQYYYGVKPVAVKSTGAMISQKVTNSLFSLLLSDFSDSAEWRGWQWVPLTAGLSEKSEIKNRAIFLPMAITSELILIGSSSVLKVERSVFRKQFRLTGKYSRDIVFFYSLNSSGLQNGAIR